MSPNLLGVAIFCHFIIQCSIIVEQIFKRSFTRQKVRHGDLGMSDIFLRIRELPQDIEIRNGRVNVHVEARKPLLLT